MDKIGKNFSGANLGQRKKSDFYETPYSITSQFLETKEIPYNSDILEPACGEHAIVKVLESYGFKVKSYDIEVNFLTDTNKYDYIITNPPFSRAKNFILHAKRLVNKKFALLLPLSYLHGKERFDLIYNDKKFPLSAVYVFTRYPMLGDNLRDDGKYRTGMMVYAWYVWDKEYKGSPLIKWLDNNKYVIGKND